MTVLELPTSTHFFVFFPFSVPEFTSVPTWYYNSEVLCRVKSGWGGGAGGTQESAQVERKGMVGEQLDLTLAEKLLKGLQGRRAL